MIYDLSNDCTDGPDIIGERISTRKSHFLVVYVDREREKIIYHPYRTSAETKEMMRSYLEDNKERRFYNFSIIPESIMSSDSDLSIRELVITDEKIMNLIEDGYSYQIGKQLQA